jgi:HSP20 family protein
MRPLRRLERSLLRRESDPFRLLRNEMETLFNRFADDFVLPESWVPAPTWNVEEAEKEMVLRLELPGFEPKEVEVSLEGTVLVVHATHTAAPAAREGEPERRREASYRFELPIGFNLETIEAHYRNGVLEVHVPRLPGAEPRRIEVKT